MIQQRGSRFGAASLLVAAVQLLLAQVSLADDPELRDAIVPLVSAHLGEVAVAIEHLETNESFRYRADEVMPTASLIKLPLMVTVYHAVARGEIDLSKPIALKNDDKVPGSGILTEHFSDGAVLPLRDYVRLMIRESDNTATNIVIDQIGLPATAQFMESLGLLHTKLHSKVYRGDTSIYVERSKQFGIGSTTANEMISLLRMLAEQQLADANYSDQMLAHLAVCDDQSKLARSLPGGMRIFHKTGAISNCRTDAGIIHTATGPVAVCVLTNKNEDQSWSANNAAELLCAEIGRIVAKRFRGVARSSLTPLQNGATGWLVESLQRTLNVRLEPSADLVVDGEFGPATESAVRRFQQVHGLEVSGVVDATTWKALGQLVPDVDLKQSIEAWNSNEAERAKQLAPSATDPPIVTCKAWIVADANTGTELYGWNVEQARPPASTTKIMTALLVAELISKDPKVAEEIVTFSQNADDTIGSSCALSVGEQVTVEQLLYGLLLPSGNDAATALAEHFGDRFLAELPETISDPYGAFVAKMNLRANELGMNGTRFANPHGLTEPTHLSTAADLARLAFEAAKHELLLKVVSTRQYACSTSSVQGFSRAVVWRNTNQLLDIDGYYGMKTGTTEAAGACFVGLASRFGKPRIVVVLGSSDSQSRFTDTRNLFRWSLARDEQ